MKFRNNEEASVSNELMCQAPRTIEMYLDNAKKAIDRVFGEDYAKDNPQLVAAFLTASTLDFTTAIIDCSYRDFSSKLDEGLCLLQDGIKLLQELIDVPGDVTQ